MPLASSSALRAGLLALLVCGCTAATGPTQAAKPATSGGVVPADWNPPPVTAARAIQLFEAVCGASLPEFASARKRMDANGITLASRIGTATRYSVTEEVSFQIHPGPGFGSTCSMVFESANAPAAVRRAVEGLGPTANTAMGRSTLYKSRAVIVQFEPTGTGNLMHLTMLSER